MVSNSLRDLWCSLENWYYRILIVMTGNLKDATLAVDALSIWYVHYYYFFNGLDH